MKEDKQVVYDCGTIKSRSLPPDETECQATSTATTISLGFGHALAITISWSQWHSIVWAIVHGIFSWFYVLYYALTR